MNLEKLATEQRNQRTMNLDEMSVLEVLQTMNKEDRTVPDAIAKVLPVIEKLVIRIIAAMKSGGRLIYAGAGTSGRLGVLDAAECPPTFGVPPGLVIGLIAGGQRAFTEAIEGSEDSMEAGKQDLENVNLTAKDVVLGLAASGRTPYVIGALQYAEKLGAATASLACNENAAISKHAQFPLEIVTGPEVLTGSTRLKAGTAQKLVLNMISTTVMIGLGKVYQNLMVDVQPTNEKLFHRAKGIIRQATGVDESAAASYFEQANGNVKAAIIMILTGMSHEEALVRLEKSEGFVRNAVKK
ncbi:N-acetylmuramic acid 6-phosphate etherase [Evansella caseinilytica]|uniref:N-acetylmuramic acid 6-phosphate etherase n=1 Tax=Evansella caseinilytica TaxID=1503961 RepID=A0A1H3UFJ5_9BACI|nr:N-acetylmuramic acid 6-phosphate etherase [Evansella caseinilytica]SDZ61194.1 N-acetylmuramic acid 6-phosphate etherase [Evansella caseinilytica]